MFLVCTAGCLGMTCLLAASATDDLSVIDDDSAFECVDGEPAADTGAAVCVDGAASTDAATCVPAVECMDGEPAAVTALAACDASSSLASSSPTPSSSLKGDGGGLADRPRECLAARTYVAAEVAADG